MVRNDRPVQATRIRRRVVILIPVFVVAVGRSLQAQEQSTPKSPTPAGIAAVRSDRAAPSSPASKVEPSRASSRPSWPLLHLPDPVGYWVARQALDLAWERLARANCADLLKTFKDRAGRPLDERLGEFAVDRQTYLTMVVFIDGSREMPCMKGGFAFTTPGSRVVRVCVEELKRTWHASPERAVSGVIHEMLHTLGLGENPPSSPEITRRVLQGCDGR
jgi:hypothetical protein